MNRKGKLLAALSMALVATQLSGCFGWFGGKDSGPKPAALVDFKPSVQVGRLWQAQAGGKATAAFSPAYAEQSVIAAAADGKITRIDRSTGRLAWQVDTGEKLSAGVGVGDGLVLVGTAKGLVLAYRLDGSLAWKASVSSEVMAPPQAAEGIVVVRTGDGRLFGLDATDGKRRWLYQKALPALTLRSHAGLLITKGAVFAGFPGGKLVALDLKTGNVGWEATVAQPRGVTELERIADITSAPVADDRQVCAVAYQGRVACFDGRTGTQVWARDVSSSHGLALGGSAVYVTEDDGAVVALDKATGSSIWKQEKLHARKVTAPAVSGDFVIVADYQGFVHWLNVNDGAFAGRASSDGTVAVAPIAAEDTVVVQGLSGAVTAFSVR